MSGAPLPARREQLERVAEHYRQQARQYAERCVSLSLLADAYGADQRSLLLELAGTARMGQVRAAGELERARRLHDSYPQVLALLRTGALLVPVVELLLRKTTHCTEQVHDRLGQVLPALLVGLDAADAYQVISRTVLTVQSELEAQQQQDRHAKAKANRGVWVFDVEDGMARVGAEVDAITARQFALDLDALVRAETVRDGRDGIVRTTGQRRADVLMELPARYRLLLHAARSGTLGALLQQAADRQAAGTTTGTDAAAGGAAGGASGGAAGGASGGAGLAASDGASGAVAARTSGGADPCEDLPADLPVSWQELAIELFRQPLGPRAIVNVHLPMSSALGLDDSPGRIDGGEHIPAWLARILIPDAALRRVAVNAATGVPLYLDHDLISSHRRPPNPPPPDTPPGAPDGTPGAPPGAPGAPPDTPPGPRPEQPPDPPGPAPTTPTGDTGPDRDEEQIQRELHQHEQSLTAARACQQALLSLITPLVLPDTTEPHYQPSRRLRTLIEHRDQRCTGPGCRRAARHCDLDHAHTFADGGPTSEPNLDAKSRRCHLARHHGWTVTRDPRTSISTWTSPDGTTYTRLPAWVPHPTHHPVVTLGLHPLQQPTATSDYPHHRPLYRPATPTPRPSTPATPPSPPSSSHDWSDDPPLF